MEVRLAGVASVAGPGDLLPAHHIIADFDQYTVLVQVPINRVRPIHLPDHKVIADSGVTPVPAHSTAYPWIELHRPVRRGDLLRVTGIYLLCQDVVAQEGVA